jgi:rubrerythrin
VLCPWISATGTLVGATTTIVPTSPEEPTTSVARSPSHRGSNLAVASYDPLYDHYSMQQQQQEQQGAASTIPFTTISAATITTTAPITVSANRKFQFDTMCKIWMHNRIQFVFLKCKHACCCQDCGLQIMDKAPRRCPICKARKEGNFRIYF